MLLSVFEWCDATAVGAAVRSSLWWFPVIEAVHLLGLSVLGGALLLVDLRLLGVGLRNQTISELADQMRPWLVGAIVVMGSTGLLLFLSEAVKCYYNDAFWLKISTLPIALLFSFTVRARVAGAGGLDASIRTRLVGATSIALWFTVAAAGRWVGYSG
ncbi:MAG TPA: DUF6644 family protein [Acidobacteriota bacterium]|nr:DUF6644 family protein [Acidobacteriota bacterium]